MKALYHQILDCSIEDLVLTVLVAGWLISIIVGFFKTDK